jgi:deoxyribonuclease V
MVSKQEWPLDVEGLVAEQIRLASSTPPPWPVPEDRLRVAAAFVAFVRGEQGPGHPGDRAWVGAVVVAGGRLLRSGTVRGEAAASYTPGLLALREGPMLQAALEPLVAEADVLMLDATGRDHPRRAGLALHLGERLGVPSVGVTHRPLLARGAEPDDVTGATSPLSIDGQQVARWVRTVAGVRPVVAHAAWRTEAATAADVVVRCLAGSRTPEPLRQARRVARERRSAAERLHDGGEVLGHA